MVALTEPRRKSPAFAAETVDGHRAAIDTPTQSKPVGAWAKIPPPALFIVPLVVGVILNHRVALPLAPGTLYPYARAFGYSLVAAAGVLLLLSPALFVRYRTTIVPHHIAKRLIIVGTYRLSRNPMYLGLTLLYLGVTLVSNALWPLFWLALPIWVMNVKTIPLEEQNLERTFGDEYRTYKRCVRRWL